MIQKITIVYNGDLDTGLDERIAGLLEFPPLNFEHTGQGYNLEDKMRTLCFERKKEV